MSRRDNAAWIEDMLEVLDRLQGEISGLSYDEYYANSQLKRAVLYDLTIIGEASGAVSDTLKNRHPDIPWGDMKGLRNRVIHAYFAVNHEIVWDILTNELPDLAPKLRSIYKQITKGIAD